MYEMYKLPHEVKSIYLGESVTRLLHLNIQSAKSKQTNFETFLYDIDCPLDIIMLTETWCQNDNDVLSLEGYQNFYLNRTTKRGGGLSILVKDMTCELVSRFSVITEDYEVLSISSDSSIFTVVYRPPAGNPLAFFRYLEDYLTYVTDQKYHTFVGGDFNIDMSSNYFLKTRFTMLLDGYGFSNFIGVPTRVTEHSSTILDLFLTNYDPLLLTACVVNSDISDHMPIYLAVKRSIHARDQKRTFRRVSYGAMIAFQEDIVKNNWDFVFSYTDPNEAYNAFFDRLLSLYTLRFPVVTKVISKKLRKPWMSNDLLKLVRKKNRLYQKFVKTRDVGILHEYKRLRNQVTGRIKHAKKNYYINLFGAGHVVKSDIAWGALNKLLGRNAKRLSPGEIVVDGEVLTGFEMAQTFNGYLANLCSEADQLLPYNCDDFPYSSDVSVFFRPVDEHEITAIFLTLNNTKSVDYFGMQIAPIKHALKGIVHCLVYIFNLCLSGGVFPEKMQVARVSVLHKGGNVHDMSNYRPISVLPVLSKALERVIHSRLTSFFDKHSFVIPSQFGFRKQRSTETALLTQKEIILKNFEDRKLTLGVFVDFSKAFDSIAHNILISKLRLYGVRGTSLSLITSYLQHRKQCVIIDDTSSSLTDITCGVPQGSILGPLLFIMYINDITSICAETQFVIYADDTSLFFTSADGNEIIQKANRVLHKLHMWSLNNKLKINVQKTNAILFQPKNKRVSLGSDIYLGTEKVKLVDTVKTLGVYFSTTLNWNNHIDRVRTKISSALGMIRRNKQYLPIQVLYMLYQAMIHSHINYCFLVWGTAAETAFNDILIIQKKFLRLFEGLSYQHTTAGLFEKHSLVPINQMYNYKLAMTYVKATKQGDPIFLELANLSPAVHAYCCRQQHTWSILKCRTKYGEQRLQHTLSTLLNKTSIDLLKCPKKSIVQHFISRGVAP